MKLKALALIVPALLIANSANSAEVYNKDGNKVDVYGKAVGLHYFTDDASKDGDLSYARFGFKGETQINNQLKGFGQWEYDIKVNNTESSGSASNATRLGFAGLKIGEYGSFDYGRNYGVVYDIEAWTDMLPEFGGDTYAGADNFMVGRTNGVATYRNTGFMGLVDGLNFALQYQGANDGNNRGEGTNNTRDVRRQNGDGFAMSTTYDFGNGINAGAAFASSDRTNDQTNGGTNALGDKAEVWTVGMKYDANSVYLAAMYAETRNMTPYGVGRTTLADGSQQYNDGNVANKTQNFEVTAQYLFDYGLRPEVSYLQSKGKNLNSNTTNVDNDKDLVKYVSVGATYSFNKNMSTYMDYKINLLDGNDSFYHDNGISTDDIIAVGLVYQF